MLPRSPRGEVRLDQVKRFALPAILVVALIATGLWRTSERAPTPENDWLAVAQAGYREHQGTLELSDDDIQRIARLFHDETSESGRSIAPLAELPLDLLGTIAGAHPFDGLASIANTESSRTSTYAVGSEVVPGVLVVAVFRFRAVVRQGDALRELRIGERRRGTPTEAPPPSSFPASSTAVSYEDMTVNGDDTDVTSSLFRDLTGPRLGDLLKQLFAEAVVEDGRITAWRLSRIRPDSVFARIGLQDGDVVTSVNDLALGEPMKAIQALKSLRTETAFRMRFRGDGVDREKRISVR